MKNFTEGSITKALVGLSVPIVITNLLHTAYQLVDTFWVGRLGAEAVAAVSLSFPIIFLMITMGVGFSIAGTILVAQYKGSQNQEKVNHVVGQTILVMLLVSILVSILGYFTAEPIVKLMGAEASVISDAVSYLQISSIGLIFLFAFFVFQSLMRGVGEVNTPLYIVFTTVMLNLVLDPLFIMGWGPIPAYGVTGAAIATVITQGIASIIGFYILFRGNRGIQLQVKNFHIDPQLIKKMFLLGLPASVEQSMKALGLTIMSFLVTSFGTVTLAAYGIGIRMMTFVIIPAFGLSMATATLVGQNMGANKPERAKEIGNKSAYVAFIILLFISAMFFIFANPLVHVFIPNDEVVAATAAVFLRYLSLAFPFIGIQLVLNGVFSGSGNTRTSMIFSIVSLWCIEFPLTYILAKHTSLAETGIWIAAPTAAVLSMLISLTYYLSNRWQNTRVIETQSPETKLEQAVLHETMIEEGK